MAPEASAAAGGGRGFPGHPQRPHGARQKQHTQNNGCGLFDKFNIVPT